MEKIIEIDLLDKYDFIEKYNENKASSDLIKYIIEEAMFITKKDDVKIVINNKCLIEKDIKNIIIEGLKREYDKSLKLHHVIDLRQVFFLILGIIFLFLYTLVDSKVIWKEILLIGAWVPIWETIELELFSDFEERRKRKILKKLIKSEIVENKS